MRLRVENQTSLKDLAVILLKVLLNPSALEQCLSQYVVQLDLLSKDTFRIILVPYASLKRQGVLAVRFLAVVGIVVAFTDSATAQRAGSYRNACGNFLFFHFFFLWFVVFNRGGEHVDNLANDCGRFQPVSIDNLFVSQ